MRGRKRNGLVSIAMGALCVGTLASPVSAQTTTNCSTFAGQITCNTAPNGFAVLGRALAARRERQRAAQEFVADLQVGRCPQALAIASQYGDANDRAMASRCVTPEASEAARAQAAEQELLKTVATAVREGRCDAAKSAALEASRLDIADQAMRLCKPATPPSANAPG